MNWSKNKSILLSRVCVILFAVLLLALDIGCYWAASWFTALRAMSRQSCIGLIVTVYLCSVFAWPLLYRLWSLLRNLKRGRVFTAANVSCLRAVSWCCAGAALVCLLSCLYYLPFLFIAIAAAFMSLIVRIIKNVFQQAIEMKTELDLTI